MKRYESPYNPSVKELSDFIIKEATAGGIRPDILERITSVFDGIEFTDHLLVQKDQVILQKDSVINQKATELQTTKQELVQNKILLAQKEQEIQLKTIEAKDPTFVNELVKTEFISSLHKLYPDSYPADYKEWSNDLPMKKHVANNDYATMIKNTKIYKKLIEEKEHNQIPKEFIKSLNELYPNAYPAKFDEWLDKLPMKKHVIENNTEVMIKNTKYYKKLIAEAQAKKLEEDTRFKTEEEARKERLLVESQQEIAELKALLIQKELEKQEALHDKSFVKNEIIEDLAEIIGLKDIEIKELSHIPVGIQIGGVEEAAQTTGVALIGDDVDIVLFH